MRTARRERAVLAGVLSVMAVLVLGPGLLPGYVLTYDMVFVPQQELLPWMLGLSEDAPRSVPQDAWVALATHVVDGALLQKLCLVAVVVVGGWGMAALLRDYPLGVRLLGALMIVWTPFVAERLVLGSWSLLLALALLPWTVHLARRVRDADHGRAALVLVVAAGSITPTGGVLLAVIAAGIVLWPRSGGWRRGDALLALGLLAVQLPWLLPAMFGGVKGGDADAVEAFALNPEGRWGPLVTALGTGGAWNADVVPASRELVSAPMATAVLVGLAAAGARDVVRALGRPAASVITVVGAVGLIVAVASALDGTRPVLTWVVLEVPGGGLLRDAQKWLLPYAFLIALAAALGAARLVRAVTDEHLRALLLTGAALVPILAVPDLVWGAGGRLSAVDYPAEWHEVRHLMSSDTRAGDAISLPWSAFRRYSWNDQRTVLDPTPRFMPRTVVVDDRLPVIVDDSVVLVEGEGGRSERIAQAIEDGLPLSDVAPRLGIRWLLIQRDQPGQVSPGSLAGARLVVDGKDLDLYDVQGPVDPAGVPRWAGWVVAADVGVIVLLTGAAGVVIFHAARGKRRAPPSIATPASLDQTERES